MIGVVGAEGPAERLAAALGEAGLDASRVDAEAAESGGADVLVAIGEPALIDLVGIDPGAPVLPVGIDDGLPAAAMDEVPAAVEAFLDGTVATRTNALLAVEVEGQPVGQALFDVTLVRSDPGRISEYSLECGGARSRFRADGVVAATPAGSHGYAHAAGGPRLGLDTDAVAVVPIAPFGLGTASWVVAPDDEPLLRIERDEGDVSLLLDGRERRRLAGPATVSLAPDGTFETVVPPR
ncbi:MAG: ATP-NAD kinase [Halobacteriales archaeon]|nr:ATP-NAD kinase [Halobacteriales archaeon]